MLVTSAPGADCATAAAATAPAGEAVIRKDGKPVIGITNPSDWKQITGDHYVSAVSADGQAYSMIATLEGAADNQAGIAKVKHGLEQYLQDIKYDDLTKTKRGALVVTGTGKAKKSGVAVVFAAGVLDSGAGQLAGRHLSSMPASRITTKKRSARSARRFASRTSSREEVASSSVRSPHRADLFGLRRSWKRAVGWVEPRLVAVRPAQAVAIGGPHDVRHRSTHPTTDCRLRAARATASRSARIR